MISTETLLDYPYLTITLTVHIDASVKHLGAVISQNDSPIALFLIKLRNPKFDNTTTEK